MSSSSVGSSGDANQDETVWNEPPTTARPISNTTKQESAQHHHPLMAVSPPTVTTATANQNDSTILLASLLQAAAASSTTEGTSTQTQQQQQQHPAASLASLAHKRVTRPLPDEQDRKKIIGCLAAILAGTYDWDIEDIPMPTTQNNNVRTLWQDPNDGRMIVPEEEEEDPGDSDNSSSSSSSSGSTYSDEDGSGNDADSTVAEIHQNALQDEDDKDNEEETDPRESRMQENENEERRSEDDDPQENDDLSDPSSSSNMSVSSSVSHGEEEDSMGEEPRPSPPPPPTTTAKSSQTGSTVAQDAPRQPHSNQHSNHHQHHHHHRGANRRIWERRISLQRYRTRRHQVFSDFLLSAAQLLLLDVSQARCFLPILEPILEPAPPPPPPPPTMDTKDTSNHATNNATTDNTDATLWEQNNDSMRQEETTTTASSDRMETDASLSSSSSVFGRSWRPSSLASEAAVTPSRRRSADMMQQHPNNHSPNPMSTTQSPSNSQDDTNERNKEEENHSNQDSILLEEEDNATDTTTTTPVNPLETTGQDSQESLLVTADDDDNVVHMQPLKTMQGAKQKSTVRLSLLQELVGSSSSDDHGDLYGDREHEDDTDSQSSSQDSSVNFSASSQGDGSHDGSQHGAQGGAMEELPSDWDPNDLIRPFLLELTPGAGFQCIALLLLQHLLQSQKGYDARIRNVLKRLAVVVLVYEMMHYEDDNDYHNIGNEEEDGDEEAYTFETKGYTSAFSAAFAKDIHPRSLQVLTERATRKFEAMEHGIALKLLNLSNAQRTSSRKASKESGAYRNNKNSDNPTYRYKQEQERPPASSKSAKAPGGPERGHIVKKQPMITVSRSQVLRGLKIGSAGVLAGTLFAVTGGLAAPAIAASIAGFAGGSTAVGAAIMTTLTSTAAVTTIFGVGGGGIAAYKMQRRTQGLTEFDFRKESGNNNNDTQSKKPSRKEAELFSTVCLSGWLRDKYDYQRPWGVHPTHPRLTDKLELLQRFYSVYKPENVPKCARILNNWKGDERSLWTLLRQKYGRDPDHVFPLDDGPRHQAALTHEENEVVDKLFIELKLMDADTDGSSGTNRTATKEELAPFEKLRHGWNRLNHRTSHQDASRQQTTHSRINPSPSFQSTASMRSTSGDSFSVPSGNNAMPSSKSSSQLGGPSTTDLSNNINSSSGPKYLMAAWDYQSRYGGELYTVRWESDLLLELCDSVADLVVEAVAGTTREILKQTALATLMTAIAWPYALVAAANMIDGTWTLAIERADEAGEELAKSLLHSTAGHRPVTLVGFSMGARTIYACLKELAKHQEKWEEQQERIKRREMNKGETHDDLDEGEEDVIYTREPASIVEDAILMGTPNHLNVMSWIACRRVVAGRLINCYSRRDLILSLMFQLKRMSIFKPVCGTCAVPAPGVENYNITNLISSHSDYCLAVSDILRLIRHGEPRPTAQSKEEDQKKINMFVVSPEPSSSNTKQNNSAELANNGAF